MFICAYLVPGTVVDAAEVWFCVNFRASDAEEKTDTQRSQVTWPRSRLFPLLDKWSGFHPQGPPTKGCWTEMPPSDKVLAKHPSPRAWEKELVGKDAPIQSS